jgi:hypothetical protein
MDQITIDACEFECSGYEEPLESEFPDKYYSLKKAEFGTDYYWQERRGHKLGIQGREVFETFGRLTDGRTGSYLGWLEDEILLSVDKEKFKEAVKEYEKQHGVSPLYGFHKYQIKKMEELA